MKVDMLVVSFLSMEINRKSRKKINIVEYTNF